jgi:hypothetical protein
VEDRTYYVRDVPGASVFQNFEVSMTQQHAVILFGLDKYDMNFPDDWKGTQVSPEIRLFFREYTIKSGLFLGPLMFLKLFDFMVFYLFHSF